MNVLRAWCVGLLLLGALACGSEDEGNRPVISVDGLGGDCPASGCRDGQDCVRANSGSGASSTCEVICASDRDCPAGLYCNLPPAPADTIPNTCIE